ncbi:unnamed protein product [Peniophora sp. CBMAI 1063]|nr:unnamed protein product [Peniophora sp. CBMAI 1063]
MHFSPTFQLLAAALLVEGTPVIQQVDRRQVTSALASATSAIGSAVVSAVSAEFTSVTGSAASTSSSSMSSDTTSSLSSSMTSAAANMTSSMATTTSSPSFSIVTPTSGPKPTLIKPSGGQGFNSTPTYQAKSDYDYQSLNLGLHQELIELDLFHHGLALFSADDFQNAGIGPEEQYLLQFMAEQEEGHAQLVANMMGFEGNWTGPEPTYQCQYNYPNFTSVRDFIEFSRLITRFGEGGTIGFLGHMDAQDSASLINDAIQTEGRQQMVFRQFSGLFPMPFWFTTSITQSMQWTLLAPYIASCPASSPEVEWTAFPTLEIDNNPNWPDLNNQAAISKNETMVTYPGRQVNFTWHDAGEKTGWNASYETKSYADGKPKYVAWISQLNTTYTPLTVNNGSNNTGYTIQPFDSVYGAGTTPLLNGTVYCLITDAAIPVTPYNLSLIEGHVLAGPALYNIG